MLRGCLEPRGGLASLPPGYVGLCARAVSHSGRHLCKGAAGQVTEREVGSHQGTCKRVEATVPGLRLGL